MTTQTQTPEKLTGAGMLHKYQKAFESLLPSHINAEQWMSVAYGALRINPQLRQAAETSPGSFMSAMMTAARLGLEPGTSEYWLTVRKRKGRPEVLGIIGYEGHIEMIYRAGAVASVVAECVYANDTFEYILGRDTKPIHKVDWFGGNRGELIGVYAYGIMKDGATSRVVVLGKSDIERIKQSSDSAQGEYSPWTKHEASMWLKSAVRQLQKWVPTSSEYRRQALRDVQQVLSEQAPTITVDATQHVEGEEPGPKDVVDAEVVDPTTGEVIN